MTVFKRLLWLLIGLGLGLLLSYPIAAQAYEVPPQELTKHIVKPPPKTGELLTIDERYQKLETFFIKYKCPQPYYVDEYIQSADRHLLPYTLLPAISLQESSCGRRFPKGTNNHWGWNHGRQKFTSVPAGIDFISDKLANGRYYKGKTIAKKLYAYNPFAYYPPKIINIMNSINALQDHN